ncbi:Rho GTPase-activating protein 11A [Pseudolycoriella hygida]|uniref:Rho GTPase-activating protein 11A n=1 Tax=Pseudolycoriella hygida TaxID=35572 RepID=A0A9Q0RZW1_9DIPT|nr:Rho GTPase-activating protein 11A [Pseudolycoriella hygida]
MLISDVAHRADVVAIVTNELRETYGIKYRRDKTQQKVLQANKINQGKIFNTHLAQLELTDVVLTNGGITQIPVFVSDACQSILEQVTTEGLFRKAGSAARQREIKAHLDKGLRLDKKYHVIDVANILKLFFRELPEPLLPPGNIQETILRSLLNKSNEIDVLMLTCLLLPPLSLNVLMFFMQFLHTISMHSDVNKMTIENLAIIFAPGIMPITEMIGQRLNCHVKIIDMLIRNSNRIGLVPKSILDKVNHAAAPSDEQNTDVVDKKKKKRRSGSLTRMFNGIRKMIGAKGSSENLDKSDEINPVTPCISKSAKKRKVTESSAFSAKKKLNVMNLLPENGSILPSTPCIKDSKRSRLSLGGKRHSKHATTSQSSAELPQIERRWSVVGPGWNKKKVNSQYEDMQSTVPLSPIISLPILPTSSNQMDLDLPIESSFAKMKRQSTLSFQTTNDDDFVRVPKVEYEAIKERVSAIENRISQEFGKVESEFFLSEADDANHGTNLENVLTKYEQTLEGTESMNASATDSLVMKLGKELKIRSAENKIIRSPSARKIGTIRRRSRENVRLSRNQSWHFGNKQPSATDFANQQNQSEQLSYPKMTLKRGRPNTLQTGLRHPSPKDSFLNGLQQSELKIDENNFADALENENWVNGEQFFSNEPMQQPPMTPTRNLRKSMEGTPRFVSHLTMGEIKTPMLPPKRSVVPRTPATIAKATARVSQRQNFINKQQSQQQSSSQLHEPQTGRASIARLRSQNAGMVAAKAKLFNGLVNEPVNNGKAKKLTETIVTNKSQDEAKKQINVKRDNRTDKPNGNSRKSTPRSTPRRHRNSHGINRRLKLRNALTPNKNSPRLTKRILESELANHTIDRDNKFNNKFASRLKITSTPDNNRDRHKRTHSKSPNKFNKAKLTPVKLRSSPRLQFRNGSNQELMPYL